MTYYVRKNEQWRNLILHFLSQLIYIVNVLVSAFTFLNYYDKNKNLFDKAFFDLRQSFTFIVNDLRLPSF